MAVLGLGLLAMRASARPAPNHTLGNPMPLQAVALVQQQGIVSAAGCAVGALTAAAMMTAMIQVGRCHRGLLRQPANLPAALHLPGPFLLHKPL